MLVRFNARELGPVFVDPTTIKAITTGTYPFLLTGSIAQMGTLITVEVGGKAYEYNVFPWPDAVVSMIDDALMHAGEHNYFSVEPAEPSNALLDRVLAVMKDYERDREDDD